MVPHYGKVHVVAFASPKEGKILKIPIEALHGQELEEAMWGP